MNPLVDWSIAMRTEIERHLCSVHPYGATVIHWWLVQMLTAAERDDATEVARLTRMVRDRLKVELGWAAEGDEC